MHQPYVDIDDALSFLFARVVTDRWLGYDSLGGGPHCTEISSVDIVHIHRLCLAFVVMFDVSFLAALIVAHSLETLCCRRQRAHVQSKSGRVFLMLEKERRWNID